MQNSTAQEQVKTYKGRDAHQKCQQDRKKMTEQGWQVISWGEIGKDLFGRVILSATYMRDE